MVDPAARNQRVGKALMARAASIAREASAGEMIWSVYQPNTIAATFYEKLGAADNRCFLYEIERRQHLTLLFRSPSPPRTLQVRYCSSAPPGFYGLLIRRQTWEAVNRCRLVAGYPLILGLPAPQDKVASLSISSYVAVTSSKSPVWYDTYEALDTEESRHAA